MVDRDDDRVGRDGLGPVPVLFAQLAHQQDGAGDPEATFGGEATGGFARTVAAQRGQHAEQDLAGFGARSAGFQAGLGLGALGQRQRPLIPGFGLRISGILGPGFGDAFIGRGGAGDALAVQLAVPVASQLGEPEERVGAGHLGLRSGGVGGAFADESVEHEQSFVELTEGAEDLGAAQRDAGEQRAERVGLREALEQFHCVPQLAFAAGRSLQRGLFRGFVETERCEFGQGRFALEIPREGFEAILRVGMSADGRQMASFDEVGSGGGRDLAEATAQRHEFFQALG